jgi:hypothetical protein
MGISEFALSLIIELLGAAIDRGVDLSVLPYFKQRKIKRRVEDATAEVVEPLLPFLEGERIPEDKQRRLIQTCVEELRPFTDKPELLFQGSLNGQKIFEQLYGNGELPQVIVEDGMRDVYTLLFPRIATLLCKIPAAVKDWENEAWSENFRRLDEIASQMLNLFGKVDELATLTQREADETLTNLRRTLAQKIRIELDLTGLRADRPVEVKFDDLFVFPEIVRKADKSRAAEDVVLDTPGECFDVLTAPRSLSVVVGEPGAGKSTWSKWLLQEALSRSWTGIAVRVELRRFSGEPLISLHELIREAGGKHLTEDLSAERIGRWLNAKQVLFILDGFDEVRVSDRDGVHEWVVDLQRAARGCPFVVTSRPLTTDHLQRFGRGWLLWAVRPFDKNRIVDYIQRWHKHTPVLLEGTREVDAEALASGWLSDPTIRPLTGNPLLLSTLLMVHHLDGRLPSGRAQLYRRYVDGMLGVWDDRRKVEAASIQISQEQKRQILRGLSLRMFLNERDEIDELETVSVVDQLLQELSLIAPADAVLALLRERTGLLVGPGTYSFVHKSVAEYLVAEAVVQGDQRDRQGDRIDRFNLFEHRHEDRWNTVTFLWSGLAPAADVEAFVDACQEAANTALAYGILLDQYERINKSKRRALMKALLNNKEHADRDDVRAWVVSLPKSKEEELWLPAFSLRGLTLDAHADWLIRRAYDDGTLTWDDADGHDGIFRDLLWMIVVVNPKNLEELANALKSHWPPIAAGAEENWLFWIMERLLLSYVIGETSLEIKDVVRVLIEQHRASVALAPLACLSSYVVAVHPELVYSDVRGVPERVPELLNVLLTLNKNLVDQGWLEGTREWHMAWFKDTRNVQDLLLLCIDKLSSIPKQDAGNELIEEAIRYVHDLKTMRDGPQGVSN